MMRMLLPLLVLAGCTDAPPGAQAEPDPAIAAALAEPLMTDPDLLAASRADAASPLQDAVPIGTEIDVPGDPPPTLGQVAGAAVKTATFAGCDPGVRYAAAWMNRLPTELALPNAARLSEAAGSDAPGCRLRIVRYAIASPVERELDRYESLARHNGFGLRRDGARIAANRGVTRFEVAIAETRQGALVDLVARN